MNLSTAQSFSDNTISGKIGKQPHNLRKFTIIFIALFGTYYLPIEGNAGLGIIKIAMMFSSLVVLFTSAFAPSQAMCCGVIYLLYQFGVAFMHPESFRWSTLLFSFGLVSTYICFYNLIYYKKVFTIDDFIKVVKGMMMAYFVICILQQMCLAVGIKSFALINLTRFLDRGLGCNSLSIEPSSFARTMLVFYYAYIKCCEYKRGSGPLSVKELLNKEHRWVTLRFFWMMITMGSGTAFVCLIALSLHFVRKNNFILMIPILLAGYIGIQTVEVESLNRATKVIEASRTLNKDNVVETDGSAAVRIIPILNTLNADLTKSETWFGHGIDYSISLPHFSRSLIDDYGLFFLIIGYMFSFICAYRFFSLGTLFMLMGVAGGCGSNVQYAWFLMMIMTCERYFHDTYANKRNN